MARTCSEPLGKGVYCAASGFMYWSSWNRGFLITEVDGTPTPNLEAFVGAVSKIPDYKRIPIRTRMVGSLDESISLIQMDWHYWFASTYIRNDMSGVWDRYDIQSPPNEAKPEANSIEPALTNDSSADECTILSVPEINPISTSSSTTSLRLSTGEATPADEEYTPNSEEIQEDATQELKQSMGNIQCYLPLSIYGESSNSAYNGVGLVISLEPIPLMLFGRDAVPSESELIRVLYFIFGAEFD